MEMQFQLDDRLWHAAYTRPRCEKVVASYCERQRLSVTLPCLQSVKRYPRKTVTFRIPLFPGYVFFQCEASLVFKVEQNEHVVKVLRIMDQITFERQLNEILCALESDYLVVRGNQVHIGGEARIKTGPLAGMLGKVAKVSNRAAVVLNLDFIGTGVAVVVDWANLEIA